MDNIESPASEETPKKYISLSAEFILQNGEKSKVINSSDDTFRVELKNQAILFDLGAEFFISKVHFEVEDVDIDRFSLRYTDISTHSEKIGDYSATESDENRLTFVIGRIIRRGELRYDKGLLDWSKPSLLGVSIIGIPLNKLEPYFQELVDSDAAKTNKLNEVEEIERRVKADREALELEKSEIENRKAEVSRQISESQNRLESLQSNLIELYGEKESSQKQVDTLKDTMREFEEKVSISRSTFSQLESDIATKINEKTNLSNDVIKVQSELRDLKKVFLSYSNEYASFNKQSNSYMIFYGLLLALPIAVLIYVFCRLIEGSAALATVYKEMPDISTYTIFLTRLPFVTIAGILIHSSYVVFKLITLKIMDIQSEKLALSKIAIIAQDVVNLSSEGLELSDEQIQDTNIYLRMELIKAHLKETIGKDYEYKIRDVSILESIRETIASKIMPFKLRSKITRSQDRD